MLKAVSEIIVGVMLLMIGVALVGAAFVFMTQFQEEAKSEVQQSGAQSLKKVGSCLEIVSFDDKANDLWVRNCGRYAIDNVTVLIDGKPAVSASINAKPNEIRNITISAFTGIHELRIAGEYASALASVNVTNIGPSCSDGTPYGQCSAAQPKYCDGGTLANKCGAPENCGCPGGGACQTDGTCLSGFDFSLSANPASGTVKQGSGVSTSVTAVLASGTAQLVSLSCSGLPSGASCSFNPVSITPTASSILTISTSAATPAGTYPITIGGTGGSVTRTAPFSLAVNPAAVWLDPWNYRKTITINGSASALTDYQIPINITTALYNNTGLAGSWHFSEGTGTMAADSSGNGKDGTLTGSPTWTTGKFGNGIQATGSAYVSIPSLDISTEWTISSWFLAPIPAPVGGWATLTRGTNDHQVIAYEGRDLGSFDNAGGTSFHDCGWDINTLSSGWHYISAVGNSSGYTNFYIDGVWKCASNFRSTADIVSLDNYQGGGQPWGTIDEMRIYSRALSEQEIADLYNATKSRPDYQDLRFTWLNSTSGAEQNISHWMESDNRAWVKVPNITASAVANTTLYMYYRNPSATYNNSLGGNNTFELFDDFDDSGYTDKWAASGTVSQTGGYIKLGPSGGSNSITSIKAFSGNYTLDSLQYRTSDENAGGSFTKAGNYYDGIWYGGSQRLRRNGAELSAAVLSLSASTWHKVSFSRINRTTNVDLKYTIEGSTLTYTDSSPVYTEYSNVYFGTWADEARVDNARVRKYASPEPSVLSVGAEQPKP